MNSLGSTPEWHIFSSEYTQELNTVMCTLLSWVEYVSVYSTHPIEWIFTHSTQLNWMHQLYSSTQLNWVEWNAWVWVYPYTHYKTGTACLWFAPLHLYYITLREPGISTPSAPTPTNGVPLGPGWPKDRPSIGTFPDFRFRIRKNRKFWKNAKKAKFRIYITLR